MHLHAPVVKVVIYHQSAISEKSLVEGHPANGVGRVGAELIRGRAAARPGIPTPDARRPTSLQSRLDCGSGRRDIPSDASDVWGTWYRSCSVHEWYCACPRAVWLFQRLLWPSAVTIGNSGVTGFTGQPGKDKGQLARDFESVMVCNLRR